MKIVYKIYHSMLSKEPGMGYAQVTPARTPDFETEAEAEEHLLKLLKDMDIPEKSDLFKRDDYFFFVQKTYAQG